MKPQFLVSRLSALGDVVCTLPVATCLKAGFPDAEITWFVDPRFAGVVECCPAVDRIELASPNLKPSSWPRVEGKFQAALDMQGLSKSAVIVWRANASSKIGYHWQREAAWLFSKRILPDPSSSHVVDQYVDVARAAGGKADRASFELEPKAEDCESVGLKLQESGVNGAFVVMNPGAGWATKRWPPKQFSQLIDRVSAEGLRVVLIGGKAAVDRSSVAEVMQGCSSKPVDLCGKTSVRELIALISKSVGHVGGDTGSTHIAAALNRPAVGLYSITRPERSCPYGQISRCHYDPTSLAGIQAEDVYRTLMEAVA